MLFTHIIFCPEAFVNSRVYPNKFIGANPLGKHSLYSCIAKKNSSKQHYIHSPGAGDILFIAVKFYLVNHCIEPRLGHSLKSLDQAYLFVYRVDRLSSRILSDLQKTKLY